MFNTLGNIDGLDGDIRGTAQADYDRRWTDAIAPGPIRPRTEIVQFNPDAEPCPEGMFHPTAYSQCVVDPGYRPQGDRPLGRMDPPLLEPTPAPATTNTPAVTASSSGGGGIGGFLGSMDTTTLLLIGAAVFFFMKRR